MENSENGIENGQVGTVDEIRSEYAHLWRRKPGLTGELRIIADEFDRIVRHFFLFDEDKILKHERLLGTDEEKELYLEEALNLIDTYRHKNHQSILSEYCDVSDFDTDPNGIIRIEIGGNAKFEPTRARLIREYEFIKKRVAYGKQGDKVPDVRERIWSGTEDQCKDLHTGLNERNLITVDWRTFKNLFFCEDGAIVTKVKWMDDDRLIAYLIDSLTKKDLIAWGEQWKFVEDSFLNKKGEAFDRKKLLNNYSGNSDKIKKKRLIDEIIKGIRPSN